jgi:hypothetical protein
MAATLADGPMEHVVELVQLLPSVVPHTGIAANVRRALAEYDCYGGLRPAPVGPDRLEGTEMAARCVPD